MDSKSYNRQRIKYRIRKKISGTASYPRLSVFRSNKQIYCQLIDDIDGRTLASASSKEVNGGAAKVDIALEVGKLIGSKAVSKDIKKVVFDRGGYLYHGRVKSLAEGARQAGLEF